MTKNKLALEHLIGSDKTLAKLIARIGPPKPRTRGMRTPFAALAESIVYQQLNGTAAATIFGRVKVICGNKQLLEPDDILAATDDQLRSAGLSRAKTLAIRDLAAKASDGTVPSLPRVRRMTDEELIERLTVVRGIGIWTVQMFLMSCLNRPDVLALGDYGLRRGFSIVFGLKQLATADQLERRGERWRPYRSLASWYLWRATELPETKKLKLN